MEDKIRALIGADADETAVAALIDICKSDAIYYCNLDEYNEKLDFIVMQMVIERYNKLNKEGLTTETSSSITNSFIDGYSLPIYQALRKFRKLRVI
jgi:hypothetical protein